uniref:Cyclin N-terminal domain-containing protein n=1 Tax=Leptobrachium leishanense TaxID=445787 RepID=A0A8C5MP16_9ANUR
MNRAPFKTKVKFSVPGIKFGVMASDIVEDILIYIAKEDKQGLDNLSEDTGCFKDPKVIELVFLLSEFWCQDRTTKYRALEILDRFMILYTENLYKSSVKAKVAGESPAKTRSSVKSSLCDTFLLHLVSCLQIASKLHFHCQIINNNMALQFLRSAGDAYTKQELLQSELTVLRTLHFQVHLLSPLSYVDVLLEVLGHNGSPLPVEDLHDVCLKVLDLVYLLREPIYEDLQTDSTDTPTASNQHRLDHRSIKEDRMLLATAVIVASAHILSHGSSMKVMHKLNYVTGIAVESAFTVSSSILKRCVGITAL